jgi:hypothetical protein
MMDCIGRNATQAVWETHGPGLHSSRVAVGRPAVPPYYFVPWLDARRWEHIYPNSKTWIPHDSSRHS